MERNILINKTTNKPGNYLSPLYLKYFLQVSFALFYIYSGFRFILFLNWATGKSEIMVDKPGAVEGFLPISALLGLKQLLQTGRWDWVHPAGLTIFIAILVISFLFRKGFCAYICPVGFISNLLAILGRKLSLSLVPHKWTGYLLTSIKYLLLGFFLYTITILMDASSVQSFIQSPYNMTADARMLNFFTHPSSFSLSIFAMIFILSVIMRNFWCRYLCPYGALLGLFSFMSPIAIKRDDELCTNCRQCSDRCPAGIKIHTQTNVRSPECIGCGDCIHHCPEKSCLSFTIFSKWPVHWSTAGIGSVAMLLVFYTWAILTKHWHTPLPPVMLQRIYGL